METVVRNVIEMNVHDRQALEQVLGQALRTDQQLVIHIIDAQVQPEALKPRAPHGANGSPVLPEWCNVYEGLSDDLIADMETTILQRADFGRPSE